MLATATLGAALALGSCGGGESHEPSSLDMEKNEKREQKDDKKAQESPTPTPSEAGPQEVPSVKPETDSKKRQQAAEDFLRSYINEMNRATRTGDYSKLRTMYTDGCELCKKTREGEKIYKEGNSIEGGKWTPKKVDYKATFKGVMMFDMTVDAKAADVIDQDGERVDGYPAATSKYRYTISEKNGEWQIVGGEPVS